MSLSPRACCLPVQLGLRQVLFYFVLFFMALRRLGNFLCRIFQTGNRNAISIFSFFKKIHLFIHLFNFWLHWVFTSRGFSLVVESGGYSLLRCTGFLLRWVLLLQSTGSRCMGFSSCGTLVAHGLQ